MRVYLFCLLFLFTSAHGLADDHECFVEVAKALIKENKEISPGDMAIWTASGGEEKFVYVKEILEDGRIKIEWRARIDAQNTIESDVKVKPESLRPTPGGSPQKVLDAFNATKTFHIDFSPQEVVRFRHHDGTMRQGIYLEDINQNQVRLKYADQTLEHPREDVFKYWGENPPYSSSTTEIDGGLLFLPHSLKDPITRELYNAAARVASHPHVLSKSTVEKIEKLVGFLAFRVRANIKSNNTFSQAVTPSLNIHHKLEQPISEMGGHVCLGMGVCRHHSLLMHNILTEAGVSSKMLFRFDEDGVGHMWLVAQIPTGKKTHTPYVIDITNDNFYPMEKSLQKSLKDPESYDAIFYQHIDRVEAGASNLNQKVDGLKNDP